MISDQAINHIFDEVVEGLAILRILIGIQNEGVVYHSEYEVHPQLLEPSHALPLP